MEDIIRNRMSFDEFVVFQSCKYNFEENIKDFHIDTIFACKRPIKVFRINHRDKSMSFSFHEFMSQDGESFEGVHIEVDLTNASCKEAYSVCRASAALDIGAYMVNSGKKSYFESVPPFVSMSEDEMAIVDTFAFKDKGFTNKMVKSKLFEDCSDLRVSRATRSLADNGFLNVLDKKTPTHRVGANQLTYVVTKEGDYMSGMNERSKRRSKKSDKIHSSNYADNPENNDGL